MSYVSRCAQLIRDLKTLGVLLKTDDINFDFDDQNHWMTLYISLCRDEEDSRRNSDKLESMVIQTCIQSAFFQEFPELGNHIESWIEDERIGFEVDLTEFI